MAILTKTEKLRNALYGTNMFIQIVRLRKAMSNHPFVSIQRLCVTRGQSADWLEYT